MMLITAAVLAVSMVLTAWIHRREGTAQRSQAAEEPVGGAGGFQLVLGNRYLFLIAILVLLSNLVNTTGEFILGKTVAEHARNIGADPKVYIGQFYANFFFWVNLIGAGLQMFAVSRVMKYIGIGAALFVLPLIALGSYTLLAIAPMLSYIRIAKIAENSADYSIQNTVRHALFLRTSRDAKYKAQSAIETFFWRTGDALSGLLVFIGTGLALSISSFAIVNVVFVLVWLGIAAAIVRVRRNERGKVPETAAGQEADAPQAA
jgi:AAA family ATP:ADP antiporter